MAKGANWSGQQRKKTAAERRAQRLRAEGRRFQHALSALHEVHQHRGGQLTKFGNALRDAIMQVAETPTQRTGNDQGTGDEHGDANVHHTTAMSPTAPSTPPPAPPQSDVANPYGGWQPSAPVVMMPATAADNALIASNRPDVDDNCTRGSDESLPQTVCNVEAGAAPGVGQSATAPLQAKAPVPARQILEEGSFGSVEQPKAMAAPGWWMGLSVAQC